MSKETWKDVDGYVGKYQVSNLGNVKSLKRYVKNKNGMRVVKEKMLKPYLNNKGYWAVSLTENHKSKLKFVHRLIAEAFIRYIDNKPFVNHKDGVKTNNNIKNLEWCTQKENVEHAIKSGKYDNVFRVARIKKPNHNIHLRKKIIQKDINGEIIKEWEGINVACKELKIDSGNVIKALKGKQKKCGGFIWEYM